MDKNATLFWLSLELVAPRPPQLTYRHNGFFLRFLSPSISSHCVAGFYPHYQSVIRLRLQLSDYRISVLTKLSIRFPALVDASMMSFV
jgi:hypothetical protein